MQPPTRPRETPAHTSPQHAASSRIRRIRHLRGDRGLTLIELLIILAVIGILSTIALLLYSDFTYRAQIARSTADIAILEGRSR
jgi:prepilin-type N-terminal cleavage/methylation domain-containing protein